jgi:hypothetical protein
LSATDRSPPAPPASLEARIQLLLDKDELRELTFLYAHRMLASDWRGIANLFTEDGVLDYSPVVALTRPAQVTQVHRDAGSDLIFVGRQAICDFIAVVGPLQVKGFFTNHVIRVTGDAAVSIAHFENRLVQQGESVAGAGRMCDEYKRVGGRWLISYRRQELFYFAALKEGWAASLERARQAAPIPQRGWEAELIRDWGSPAAEPR